MFIHVHIHVYVHVYVHLHVYVHMHVYVSRETEGKCVCMTTFVLFLCVTHLYTRYMQTLNLLQLFVLLTKLIVYDMLEGAYGCTYVCMIYILCVWLSLTVSGCLDRSLCFNVAIGFSA